MNRYLYMLRWGILYTIFCCLIVGLYAGINRLCCKRTLTFNSRKVVIHPGDFFIVLLLTFISAVRCNTGTDFYNYYTIYNNVLNNYTDFISIIKEGVGTGYLLLSYLVKTYFKFEYAIFGIIAFFVYYTIIHYLRCKSINPTIGLLVYMLLGYHSMANNMLKQIISMLFILFAYDFLCQKKVIKFIAFSAIACIFHISALIIIPLLIISQLIKPSMINFFFAILLGILGFFIYPYVFIFIFRLFPFLNGFSKYITWHRNTQIRLILAVLGNVFIYSALTFSFIYYKKQIKEISIKSYNMISLFIIALPINIIAVDIWIINRISLYLYQFAIFLIPLLLEVPEIKNKKRQVLTVLFIIFIFYSIFTSVFLGENEYYNYFTIFNSVPETIREFNAKLGYIRLDMLK